MRSKRSLWLKPFLLLTSLSLLGVVIGGPAGAVMYGDPVLNPSLEFPEVVSIWNDADFAEGSTYSPEFSCTGFLVEQDVVITAAHCIQGLVGELIVEVNASELGKGTRIPVDATWYNPRYSSARIANDVGVLHLQWPAQVSRLASLTRTPIKNPKKPLTLVGWGDDQNGDLTSRLHQIRVRPDDVRARSAFGREYNPRTTLAAGRYFRVERVYGGACNGDSGGPLYYGNPRNSPRVVGIVSYGVRGCDEDAPTVFARTSFYLAAINQGIASVKASAISGNVGRPYYYSGGEPTVSGTAAVGATLTCNKGSWTPNASSITASWYRDSSSTITTAAEFIVNGDTYSLSTSDVGKHLYCLVTATNSSAGRKSIAASPAFSAVGVKQEAKDGVTASFVLSRPYSSLFYWRATVTAKASPNRVVSWCFFLDDRTTTLSEIDYAMGSFPFSPDADGCFRSNSIYRDLTSGSVEFKFSALTAGSHTLYALVTDSSGETVKTDIATFTK